jgi:hypothetical protein
MKKISAGFLGCLLFATQAFAQMPAVITKNGRHALLVDGKPFFILGGQAHNSSAWPALMPAVWSAVEKMYLNTLEVPVYWEQVEAQPDHFDFSLVDTLLRQAREHHIRLVLLWFATWKNGSNHYMPEWMKHAAGKYPNIISASGHPVDSPSPNIDETRDADIHAFTAFMKYLKSADGQQHTVIMVQVENESGAWGSVRDYSPAVQKMFEGAVPAELLKPALLTALNRPPVTKGSWAEVFGDRADEYFQAWSVARFVGQVAAAGKAVYPLPLYVNAALRDPLTNPTANNYESGGPTDNVIPIWKAAAPDIDLLAPDIYLSGSERIIKVIDLYDRPDNALFVPEIAIKPVYAKWLYAVMARGGIGYSPFGIDDNGHGEADSETMERLAPFAHEYGMFGPMIGELAAWAHDGKIRAVVEGDDHGEQSADLGSWQAKILFGGNGRANAAPVFSEPTGKVMFVQLDENKFIVMGTSCHIRFQPAGDKAGKAWQYLKVEEGKYENGAFRLLRILNGDETDWGGPGFGPSPTLLRITLITR